MKILHLTFYLFCFLIFSQVEIYDKEIIELRLSQNIETNNEKPFYFRAEILKTSDQVKKIFSDPLFFNGVITNKKILPDKFTRLDITWNQLIIKDRTFPIYYNSIIETNDIIIPAGTIIKAKGQEGSLVTVINSHITGEEKGNFLETKKNIVATTTTNDQGTKKTFSGSSYLNDSSQKGGIQFPSNDNTSYRSSNNKSFKPCEPEIDNTNKILLLRNQSVTTSEGSVISEGNCVPSGETIKNLKTVVNPLCPNIPIFNVETKTVYLPHNEVITYNKENYLISECIINKENIASKTNMFIENCGTIIEDGTKYYKTMQYYINEKGEKKYNLYSLDPKISEEEQRCRFKGDPVIEEIKIPSTITENCTVSFEKDGYAYIPYDIVSAGKTIQTCEKEELKDPESKFKKPIITNFCGISNPHTDTNEGSILQWKYFIDETGNKQFDKSILKNPTKEENNNIKSLFCTEDSTKKVKPKKNICLTQNQEKGFQYIYDLETSGITLEKTDIDPKDIIIDECSSSKYLIDRSCEEIYFKQQATDANLDSFWYPKFAKVYRLSNTNEKIYDFKNEKDKCIDIEEYIKNKEIEIEPDYRFIEVIKDNYTESDYEFCYEKNKRAEPKYSAGYDLVNIPIIIKQENYKIDPQKEGNKFFTIENVCENKIPVYHTIKEKVNKTIKAIKKTTNDDFVKDHEKSFTDPENFLSYLIDKPYDDYRLYFENPDEDWKTYTAIKYNYRACTSIFDFSLITITISPAFNLSKEIPWYTSYKNHKNIINENSMKRSFFAKGSNWITQRDIQNNRATSLKKDDFLGYRVTISSPYTKPYIFIGLEIDLIEKETTKYISDKKQKESYIIPNPDNTNPIFTLYYDAQSLNIECTRIRDTDTGD